MHKSVFRSSCTFTSALDPVGISEWTVHENRLFGALVQQAQELLPVLCCADASSEFDFAWTPRSEPQTAPTGPFRSSTISMTTVVPQTLEPGSPSDTIPQARIGDLGFGSIRRPNLAESPAMATCEARDHPGLARRRIGLSLGPIRPAPCVSFGESGPRVHVSNAVVI